MIKVVLDATHFQTATPTGVERYTDAILPLLSDELVRQKVGVYWVGNQERKPMGLPDGVQWIHSPHTLWWSQRGLVKTLKELKPNLYFTPSGIAPLQSPCPTVMTVHDLSVYHAPSAYTLGQRIRLMYFNRLAAQRAALVIVPSHAVAKDCQTFWNINPQKICVVPHGYYAGTSLPKMDSPTPTVLFVGRVEKKKNLSVVMKAWELVQPKHPFKLIIAGGPGYGWKSIYHQSRIVAQKYPERIVFTGRITEDARRRYMASAWALVVPSPYEGFGLPVLEGFDAKTPVICAEAGSLPEVGGKAVLYADPYDEQQWAKQIEQLIENPEKRRQLRRLGTERLRHYRWEVSAKETALAILKTIDQR